MEVVRRPLTQRDHDEVWLRWRQGWTLGRIGRSMGRSTGTVQAIVARTGGVRPPVRTRGADLLRGPGREAKEAADRVEDNEGLGLRHRETDQHGTFEPSGDDRNAGENPSQGRDAGALGEASER